jgi:hypothetical protein
MRLRARARALAAAVPALAALAACDSVLTSTSSGSTTTLASVTGLDVHATSVVDPIGCGAGPNDVYRWGGVVRASGSSTPIAARLVECFADLVFHDLPRGDAALDAYEVALVAFTKPGWDALTPTQQADLLAGKPEAFSGAGARWVTTCTGVQEQGLRREAVCAPFASVAP